MAGEYLLLALSLGHFRLTVVLHDMVLGQPFMSSVHGSFTMVYIFIRGGGSPDKEADRQSSCGPHHVFERVHCACTLRECGKNRREESDIHVIGSSVRVTILALPPSAHRYTTSSTLRSEYDFLSG